jgi:hypothetical protein
MRRRLALLSVERRRVLSELAAQLTWNPFMGDGGGDAIAWPGQRSGPVRRIDRVGTVG